MIEIIQRGPKAIKTCPKCGCKFSFEKSDICVSKYEYTGSQTYYISCPQCNATLDIYLNIFKNRVGDS